VYVQDLQNNQVLTYISANTRFENKTLDIDNVDGLQTELDGKLNLTGGTLTGDLTIPDKIIHSGDTNTAIRFPAADTVTVETAGSERVRVDSNGNVGIGTSAPAAQLHVAGTTTNSGNFTASITDTTMNVTAVSTGAIAVGDIIYGIGVSPITKVTALGTGTGGVGTYTVSVSQTRTATTLYAGSGSASTIRISDTDTVVLPGQSSGTIEFFGSDGTAPGAGVGAYISAVAEGVAPDTALTFGTRDNVGSGIDANERMRIASNGNVGIGTTNPVKKLTLSVSPSSTFDDGIRISDGSNFTILSRTGSAYTYRGVSANASMLYSNSAMAFLSDDTTIGITFHNAGNERLRITPTGNVGIGTSSPQATLDIPGHTDSYNTAQFGAFGVQSVNDTNGFLSVNGYWTGTDWIYRSNGTSSLIQFATGDILLRTVPSGISGEIGTITTRLTVKNTGNVGIGTDSPSTKLSVVGSITANTFSATTGNVSAPAFSASTDTNTGMYFPTADTIAFAEGGSEVMRIDSIGRIGIGTSAPQRPLHIANVEPTVLLEETDQATDESRWRMYNSASNFIIGTVNDAFSAGQSAYTILRGNGIAVATHVWGTDNSERMRITSNGRVGIGILNPGSQLHVSSPNTTAETIAGFGNGNISPGLEITTNGNLDWGLNAFNSRNLTFSTNQTERMRISSIGNVGIGTTNPSYTLDVVSDSSSRGIQIRGRSADDIGIFRFVTNTNSAELFKIQVSNVSTNINSVLATPMVFFTNNTEKMRIIANGNVGIGTNIPDVGLHYTGDTPKLRIESTNSLDDTLGTEEIGRIEWEAARGTNRNVPASIRVQQAGTWSAVTPWFSPTSMGFYTQDSSGVEVTSPRLFIGSTGNVGIGTTTPASIVGGTDTSPVLSIGGTDAVLVVGDKAGSLSFITSDPSYTSTYADGVASEIASVSDSAVGSAYGLSFYTGTTTGVNRTERMRITSTGNVGIGTQIPGTLLHLEAGTALQLRLQRTGGFPSTAYVGNEGTLLVLSSNATGVAINTGASPTEKMRVTTAGFVGIGTTTPATILDVNGDVTITDKIIHSGDTNTAIRFPAADTVSVETAGSERVRIEADGTFVFNNAIKENVFVLTGTTPALDPVNGTIQTWTLTGNSTPTDSLASGEHMTLLIDDGAAHTITWPSVTWKTNAGAAPTLLTTGLTVIVLWKVDTVLYGARVGDA
jgi:hypothetical protein